ncbi:MAG TPA: carbamoyltransferase HypF [Chthoniobacterales bacterium]|nr:carbamoyltransferase HypF [Chthoniobacterales bacterium]
MKERPASAPGRLRIKVLGAVQGVGFRPFVYHLANELELNGWVLNSAQGVFIEVEGPPEKLAGFAQRLRSEKPARAIIQSCESAHLDALGYEKFEIRESTDQGGKSALILPDIATCDDCLREILQPNDRRFRYPFTNCTNCGPRFSIIEALPYDRANTSMKKFTMCEECAREYHDPDDRRFHAEPIACARCGPQLQLWNSLGENVAHADAALPETAGQIRDGKIVALKGIGGFQLLVDARSDAAVQRLRERKHREEKPFALMFPSLESIRECCDVSESEERLLVSPESPIVILKQSAISNPQSAISTSIAPGNPNLGVMLPYSPLHHLLLRELNFPVVATSGNLSDEPICIDQHEAVERLRGIADFFLVHDRPIVRHVDDSIVRIMAGREMMLRRARGYAPLPISLRGAHAPSRVPAGASPAGRENASLSERPGNSDNVEVVTSASASGEAPDAARDGACGPQILAVGAHLKNAIALRVEGNVFVSQHIGDLATKQAHDAFLCSVTDLPRLYGAQPAIVAHDLHPEYLSTKHALEQPGRKVAVQHHWAHIASCMAENGIEPPLLGVAWDGTGYGSDGTIWGGEFFLVKEDSCRRVAHLRTFRLPGGEAAVKEPRRSALGLLHEIWSEELWKKSNLLEDFSAGELKTLRGMLVRRINSPLTSSAGRLFDGVAAIAGLRTRSTFEGQAAMDLEFAVDPAVADSYPFTIGATKPFIIDWAPSLRAIVKDRSQNISAGVIAARFHNMLADVILAIAQRCNQSKVILSGGCFQNRYLTERIIAQLQAARFQPCWHQRIPPNDGGISLGQVWLATSAIREIE